MIPIHELLNRIRWDEACDDADFVIGYCDRMEDQLKVPEGFNFDQLQDTV